MRAAWTRGGFPKHADDSETQRQGESCRQARDQWFASAPAPNFFQPTARTGQNRLVMRKPVAVPPPAPARCDTVWRVLSPGTSGKSFPNRAAHWR